MQNSFGETLRQWRGQRRMSQLDLGLTANVSARHISFLETGRARPSQSMAMQLCETLELPHSARNAFLGAAGFAPAYRRRELSDDDMAHVRGAVEWTLQRHDPYPAFALDKHWRVVKANSSATMLFGGIGLGEGDSLLDAMLDAELISAALENWQDVLQHMAVRLRTESAHLGGDAVLDKAVEQLTRMIGPGSHGSTGTLPAVIPARYRAGTNTLSFFSTLAQFGTPEDIAVAELKIEMMFPADDATRDALLAMQSAG
ncbi:MAG: helix-turn-helix domain-containing protein [Anderseniella sp.]